MSNILKLYQSILNSRLIDFLEKKNYFHDEQHGFRKMRSIEDCHMLLKEIVNSYKYKKGPRGGTAGPRPLYMAFLDMRKAFDRVPRQVLFQKLRKAGVSEHFLDIIKDQFSNIKGRFRLEGRQTDTFDIKGGVVQGSRLGPILFDVFLNDLIGEIKSKCKCISVRGTNLNVLAYADDLVLIASTPQELNKMLKIANSWSIDNFMEFNAKKSECLVVHNSRISKTNRKKLKFQLGKYVLKIIEQYKYLGVIVSQKGDFNFKSRCYKIFLKKSMEKARARLARVRILGFHKDGLRPETSVRLYKSLTVQF